MIKKPFLINESYLKNGWSCFFDALDVNKIKDENIFDLKVLFLCHNEYEEGISLFLMDIFNYKKRPDDYIKQIKFEIVINKTLSSGVDYSFPSDIGKEKILDFIKENYPESFLFLIFFNSDNYIND